MNKYKKHCLLVLLNIVGLLMISYEFPFIDYGEAKADDFNFIVQTGITYFSDSQTFSAEQLGARFPDILSGLKLTSLEIKPEKQTAIAYYGKNKYKVSITDDFYSHFWRIGEFTEKYNSFGPSAIDKKHIATVRDGYKTITVIEKDSISVSFVFKKRYLFVITGYQHQTPYMVWRFLELNNFRKLPE